MFDELPRTRLEAKAIGAKYFCTGDLCKNGHLDKRYVSSGSCAECERIKLRDRYANNPEKHKEAVARHYEDNREAVLERKRRHREENRDAINKRRKQLRPALTEKEKKRNADYRANNRDRVLARKRQYYKENKERYRQWRRDWQEINPGAQGAYIRRRCAEDPAFAVMRAVRDMVRRCLFRNGDSATRVAESLGYTKDQLVTHLEKQFSKGMNWDNYGEWHIDHIVPISKLRKSGETRPEVVNCLTNLRPMWASANRKKSDKETHLI